MADEKKQPTKEDFENQRKSLEDNLKNNFYLDVLGINELRGEKTRAFYGTNGESIGNGQYKNVMTGSDADKLRKQLYENQMKERDSLGIADMPEYTSNYQITRYVLGIFNDSLNLPVGKLEEIVGGMAKGAKFEIPQELKDYEAKKINTIENGIIAGKKMPEIQASLELDEVSEQKIGQYRKAAYALLKQSAAYRVMDKHRYDEFNAVAGKLAKDYREAKGIPEPEKKEEPKKPEAPKGKKK